MEPLTVALPTGRLFPAAAELLQLAGILNTLPAERTLVLPATDGWRVLIARPADILTYVEHGAADVGIVGKDLLLEQARDVYELLDLGFGVCRGVIALPMESAARYEQTVWLRIASKYPRVTARYFEAVRRPVEVIEVHGAVELAPRVGLADGIMDLVMTGQTLRANLLVEVAQVFRSTARLVVNRVSLRLCAPAVRALIEGLETARRLLPAMTGGGDAG